MFNNILFVCTGNICRSPTAEYLMQSLLTQNNISISSAGLNAIIGSPIDATAAQVLADNGIYYQSHTARQLQTSHLLDADIILAMEKNHINTILNLSPEIRGKVFLLGKWQNDREIPDPYKKSRTNYDHTYRLIDEGVRAWVQRITS